LKRFRSIAAKYSNLESACLRMVTQWNMFGFIVVRNGPVTAFS